MQSNPILVEVYREGVRESFHRGVVCVVNEKNEVVFSKGDIQQVCYPRSAMKFLQVLPLIESGAAKHFGFTDEEIAVMCGSHNGEPEHVRVVESILKKAGYTADALQCGPQYPSAKKYAEELIRAGTKAGAIHNNCSGKHAGMLALNRFLGADHTTYIDPKHPVQQLILKVCAEMYEYPADKMVTALDGCSAPIFSVPVFNQAVAYKNLTGISSISEERKAACKITVNAVSRYPFMVAGSKRYCTDMLTVTAPQVIGKTGAEGVFCMTFTAQKLGVCIKIDDGKMQPQYHVAQALLEASGLFSKEQMKPLHHYMQTEIRNFNKFITGEMVAKEGLFDGFAL